MPAADRRTQRAGFLAGGGVNEGRAQDIGQPNDQRIDSLAERARLFRVRNFPEMRQVPGRHRHVAGDDLAVELQRGRGVAKYLFGIFVVVRDDAFGRRRPQFGQRPRIASSDTRTDFAFERERVFAQPLARHSARCHFEEYLIDDAGERARGDGAAAVSDQHQRKVVA